MSAPDIPDFRPGVTVGSVPDILNALVRDPFLGLLDRPRFRARRTTALTVAENTHQYIPWNQIDEDSHGGWASAQPTRYTVPDGWSGWWLVDAGVSLSGTGAAGLVVIPSVAVDGGSHTGAGGVGWEGIEPFVPLGASDPIYVPSSWRVYAAAGDWIEIDLWYSTESAITAVDTTAGRECRISLVWDSV